MRASAFLALLALISCGCTASRPIFSTSTVVKNDELPVTPRALEQLPVGRYYRIHTTDPQVAYVGQIIRVDGDQVELGDVDRETRKASGIMSRMPLLGFGHSNKPPASVEILSENKTLSRTEIASMELMSPVEVNHRLTVKQHSYSEPSAKAEKAEQVATKREEGWHAAG